MLAPRVPLEVLDPLGRRVTQDLKVQLELSVPLEQPERRDRKAGLDSRVRKALRVTQVMVLASPGHKVRRETLASLVPRVSLDQLALPELQAPKVRRETLVFKAPKVSQDRRELRATRGSPAPKVCPALLALKVTLAMLGRLARKVSKV